MCKHDAPTVGSVYMSVQLRRVGIGIAPCLTYLGKSGVAHPTWKTCLLLYRRDAVHNPSHPHGA